MNFGRYKVVGELGRGAMGTVYRATDPMIEREVAIKTLLPNLPEEQLEEVRGRFLREAKSAGRLNHPNVVAIYDVGEQDGVAYIAMELLEGRSLQEIMREPQRLAFNVIADLIAQVADGLDHAHGFKVVHRDVKPANIVVSPAGRAKLTDFGVAHVPSSTMTQTGQALGSPKYMSPEQVLGQPVDPRSDIFSLGVVLYEMLVRKTPFERAGDTNIFALMHRIAGEAHPPVTKVDASIPGAFDAVLARALAKKPEQRYQRAAEMSAALRQISGTAGAGAPAAAAASGTAFEKTVKLAALGPTPESERTKTQLLADVEDFARNFEAEERKRVQAEAEARRKKEAELQRWAEAEAKRREEYERQKEASTPGGQTTTKRSAALEMLRKKSAERSTTDARAGQSRAETVIALDERLRAAFQYLSEFTVEMNAANPICERSYEVRRHVELARPTLSEGFTDYRSRDIDGKKRFDFVSFKYKVTGDKPVALTLPAAEVAPFRERLERLKIEFQTTGKPFSPGIDTTATFTLRGPFPCGAVVRGDYDKAAIVIDLENVRRYGVRRAQLPLAAFTDDVLDKFGTYMLGVDDEFEKLLAR